MKMTGFTLIESLLVLVLVLTFSLYASGSFQQLFLGTELTRTMNDLSTSLRFARSQAIMHNQYLMVCPSSDQVSCNNSRLWHTGWLVVSSDISPEGADSTIEQHVEQIQTPNSALHISSNRDYFLFRPYGRRSSNGTVTFCDQDAELPGRALILSYTGRVRLSDKLPSGSSPQCGSQ